LNEEIKLAKKRDPKKKGRENFVNFLSKTSVGENCHRCK
jgi:hypothetical protein